MISRPVSKILNAPMAEWPQRLNATRTPLHDVERELSSILQRTALLHSYVSNRFNTGCGDQGHEAAVKRANKELTRIRKAMGFSYPDQHVEMS